MKYRVLRNCYGFLGRYWYRDEEVDLDPKIIPPVEHFVLLDAVVEPPVTVAETAPAEAETSAPTVESPTAKKANKPKKRLK